MKKTEQIEREVIETVTDEETFWVCDDCGLEHDEDELVPVAVDPGTAFSRDEIFEEVKTVFKSYIEEESWVEKMDVLDDLGDEVWGVEKAGYNAIHGSRYIHGIKLDKHSNRIGNRIRSGLEDKKYNAASSLDVCPGCLNQNFGIELEEHNGQRYEERNIEVERDENAYWDDFKFGAMMGFIPLIGQIAILGTLLDGDKLRFAGVLLSHLVWACLILSLAVIFS